jgi:methyl-accepting chemotaxis protein
MNQKEEVAGFFKEIYRKSDRVVETLLIGYFVFGLALSMFYDTYLVGIGVGGLCLILYYGSKRIYKGSTVHHYIASLVTSIFMAQFIYQMHGMFEMHFTAFIAVVVMVTYQNKYVFIPQLLFVVVHHSTFAYIQYLGYTDSNEAYQQIYFTQLDYMDFQTFLFHAGLYAVAVVIGGVLTHNMESSTINSAKNTIKLQKNEQNVAQNISFANNIAKGNFDEAYQLMEGDKLGEALSEMRDGLKESIERENREKFINVGMAEISEIIRNDLEDLNGLSHSLITYLVKYLNANQGGFFVLAEEEEEEFLELTACYAYERKKSLKKRVEIGEGLVGQCYLEREIINMRQIPDDYINITSGLGKATATNLVVIPIKNDQSIEGIMEIASFTRFKDYEIEFLKRISENIATTITSAKVTKKTKMLFEHSQQQTEEMRAQEEEMRQNMEELSATQEEMSRKEQEYLNQIDELKNELESIASKA